MAFIYTVRQDIFDIMKTETHRHAYALICLLLILLKIWLIAENEIVAMPYDAEGYVTRATNGLWEIGLMHSGYPIWLRLTQQVGFPQRISIEILYLASCFFVSVSVKAYIHYVGAILLFLILAFAPFTYFLFDQALSDGFYLCLTLFALGFSIKIISCGQLKTSTLIKSASGLGVTLGIMLITRAEDQLIFFWIFVIVALSTAFCRVKGVSFFRLDFWRRPFCVFLIISISSFLIVNSMNTLFFLKSGVFARSLTLLPSHYKLLEKLAMIDSGSLQIRYIPISRASRELAYISSPTLSNLRDEVENTNNILQAASREAGLPNGEIGAGWIWWAFLGAMYKTVPDANPVKLNNIFMKTNDELDAAFADGRLKKRFIVNPLIGGNIPQLIADFPSGVANVLRKVFSSYPYVSDQVISSNIFNSVCLRRESLIGHPKRVVIQGWAFATVPTKEISYMLPRTVDGNYGKATYIERIDVSNGYAKSSGWKPNVYGYRIELNARSVQDVTLTYVLNDGTTLDSNVFSEGQVLTVESKANNGSKILQGTDFARLDSPEVRSGIRHEIQKTLAGYMASSATILVASGISIIFFVLVLFKVISERSADIGNIYILTIFVFLIFSARILFYALIETASWHVEIRYLASAQSMFFIFISLSLVVLFGLRAK